MQFLKIWKFKTKHSKLNHKIFHKRAFQRKNLTRLVECLEWKEEFKAHKIRIKKLIWNFSNFLKFNFKVKCKRNKFCNKVKVKMTFWIWIRLVHPNRNRKHHQMELVWKTTSDGQINRLMPRRLSNRYVTLIKLWPWTTKKRALIKIILW